MQIGDCIIWYGVYSLKSEVGEKDRVAIVLGPLSIHEGVLLEVLVDTKEVEERHLEGSIQPWVVGAEGLDGSHTLGSLEVPHDEALSHIGENCADSEIGVVEKIGHIAGHGEGEVGEHVLDPKSGDWGEDQLEDLGHAEDVESEASAPESKMSNGGILESLKTWCEMSSVGLVVHISPGTAILGLIGDVLLVEEDEGDDDGVGAGDLGHRVQLLGHVVGIVVEWVGWITTTAVVNVRA